jgi:hypothetical protein
MPLFWLRVSPSYPVLAFFFRVDPSTICRNLAQIMALLETLTEFAFERPKEECKKLRSTQAVLDAFPEGVLVVDAKEPRMRRPIPHQDRAGNKEDTQKPFYAGKKKEPTLQNAFAVTPCGTVGCVSQSFAGGANHDLTVTRKSGLLDRLDPSEGAVLTDSGYDGLGKDYPHPCLFQVQKARRNHPRTPEQKAFNRLIGRYRLIVEHTLAPMKVFAVLAQTYRHPRERHGQIVRVVAGLVNRRIAECPLKTYGAQLGLSL